MNVTVPDHTELPGYLGLAIGGVLFGMGIPSIASSAATAEPFLLVGGIIGLASAGYLAILVRTGATGTR